MNPNFVQFIRKQTGWLMVSFLQLFHSIESGILPNCFMNMLAPRPAVSDFYKHIFFFILKHFVIASNYMYMT